MEYETARRQRSAHLGHLTRLYKEIETLMCDKTNICQVRTLYKDLVDRFVTFKSAHTECIELCNDEKVIDDLRSNFERCKTNFDEFEQRYLEWNPGYAESDVHSSVSSTTRQRGAKLKRLIEEENLRTLKEKLKIDALRRELDDRQKILEQESKIKAAILEESHFSESEQQTCVPTHCVSRTSIVTGNRRQSPRGVFDSEGEIVQESPVNDRLHLGTDRLAAISPERHGNDRFYSDVDRLAAVINLPKPDLISFSGCALDYCKFIKNFETNIEYQTTDNRMRLSYLIQYCSGEAKACIEDCVLLDAEVGYRRAKEILHSRYGRSHVIARSHIDKLLNGPQIRTSVADDLSMLALDMQKCQITLSQLGFVSDVDNSENLRRIVRRLPMHLRSKWADIALSIFDSGREPNFSDLTRFLDDKSRVACSVYGLDVVKDSSNTRPSKTIHGSLEPSVLGRVTTLSTSAEQNTKYMYNRKCICCSGACTDLAYCQKFKDMTLDDRKTYVIQSRLCFNCLKRNHVSRKCWREKLCTVSDCVGKHHSLLHGGVQTRSDNAVTQPSVNCAAVNDSSVKTCLGIIPVTVKGDNGYFCRTYALLDDGADKTLCDERLIRKLQLLSRPVTFQIATVSSTGSTSRGQEVDISVCSNFDKDADIVLNNVWSVKQLPISTRSAATADDIRDIPYLSDLHVPDVKADEVMLLIGTDNPEAHIPLEVRTGSSHEPYAIRTRLGWAIRGPIHKVGHNMMQRTGESVNINFGQCRDVTLQQQLERMWTSDFNDASHYEKESMSVEDKRALAIMESTIAHRDGHYEMGLPWRTDNVHLPNNLALAHSRLNQLKRKLSRDKLLHEMYTKTVTDYIDKGYAKSVEDKDTQSKRIWYLPHHPVLNVNKPGKVRVVFDCAAKYKGTSLNCQLLQGPDLMNSLVGVLTRFRQEKIAIAADIEAMFHQVRVCEADCDALRFLWWPGGDMSRCPKTYCMQVHLFGTTSSPSCATYALKRTAIDKADKFSKYAIETVDKNFYVDDCLKSVGSENNAIKLAAELRELLKMGGFRLTKWISNSSAVLDTIPESERAHTTVDLNPDESLKCDRALGVSWNVNDDEIRFKIKISDKPLTRRGILSVTSAIYDPLGLVAPVTLKAKIIVQNLCRQKLGWDDRIPVKDQEEWTKWISNVPRLENVHIQRCYQPKYFSKLESTQLHIFSDGSETGYGACAYLRMCDGQGSIACNLVFGKSRLAPIKQMSIPRLELSGAVTSCRMYAMLKEELDLKIDTTVFWTDSMIVIGYINNTNRRFKTFVGNRLSYIQEMTSPEQWRYVDSNSNPADLASRGIDPGDEINLKIWINGPYFLTQDESTWPRLQNEPEIEDSDTEVKREIAINAATLYTGSNIGDLIKHFSDWNKLLRAFAWLQRFITYCRRQNLSSERELKRGELVVVEIQNAEQIILRHIQKVNFQQELDDLKKGNPVKKKSRLAMLSPILTNGLIRMSGRQSHTKHDKAPIILPNGDHVTELIIRKCHNNNGHVGRQHVLAETREKYWILRGPSAVKKTIGKCIACKRQRGPLLLQQMGTLIPEQTTPDKPPFTYVGVDYFGPLMVKVGRSSVKRYGCLFTCLTTRAVHIEIAHSLTTDSFIAAYERFTSRRGRPDKMFSDNGTNLVSGDKELRRSLEEWNQSKIGRYLLQHNTEWQFNPPYASHMGGAWERMIRSARIILKALAKEQLLTDEKLLTLIAETERIINDRPITPVSSDPRDLPALTPSMLLLMKSNQSIPKGVFQKDDIYGKRWWKQIQYLSGVFWKRWVKEYLPSLQTRQKWQREVKNLRVDDIVLVVDGNIPRGQWPLGRVTEVFKGRDGLVRKCMVRTRNANVLRPITKLCLLESTD